MHAKGEELHWKRLGHSGVRLIYFRTLDAKRLGVCTWEFAQDVGVKSASAMTINAAQGSEFDHMIYVIPECEKFYESQAALYTAVTRARCSVTLFLNNCIAGLEMMSKRVERKRQSLIHVHLEELCPKAKNGR